jgi:hypothetical protein
MDLHEAFQILCHPTLHSRGMLARAASVAADEGMRLRRDLRQQRERNDAMQKELTELDTELDAVIGILERLQAEGVEA